MCARNGLSARPNPSRRSPSSIARATAWTRSAPASIPAQTTRGRSRFGNAPRPPSAATGASSPSAALRTESHARRTPASSRSPRNRAVKCRFSDFTQESPPVFGARSWTTAARYCLHASGRRIATNVRVIAIPPPGVSPRRLQQVPAREVERVGGRPRDDFIARAPEDVAHAGRARSGREAQVDEADGLLRTPSVRTRDSGRGQGQVAVETL